MFRRHHRTTQFKIPSGAALPIVLAFGFLAATGANTIASSQPQIQGFAASPALNTSYSRDQIPRFTGVVGVFAMEPDSNEKAFLIFLKANKRNIIHLDITLNNFQSDTMRNPVPEGNGRKRYSFDIPNDWKRPRLGGAQIEFLISPGNLFHFAPGPGSAHILGFFKSVGITGPEQGYTSHILRPANIEKMPQ